jgi:hypothetical protein
MGMVHLPNKNKFDLRYDKFFITKASGHIPLIQSNHAQMEKNPCSSNLEKATCD